MDRVKQRFTQCKLVWAGISGGEQCRRAVELCHLAGFFSVNMQFPAAVPPDRAVDPEILYLWPSDAPQADNALPVCLDGDFAAQWTRLFELLSHRGPFDVSAAPPAGYRAANEQALAPVHPPRDGGLEDLFSPGWALLDEDNDGLADRVSCRILLPDSADEAQCLAACDLAARLGMETVGIHFPLTLPADDGESHFIRFCSAGEPGVSLDACEPRRLVTFGGDGPALTAFVSQFCETFPQAADHRTLSDVARHLESALRMENFDGQAAVLSLIDEPAQGFLSADAPLERLRPLFPQAGLRHYTDFQPVFTLHCAPAWEVDEARAALEETLTRLPPGRPVRLRGFISEDAGVRRQLADWFCERALAQGASSADAELLCACKPGLSWLEESFAPRAAALGGIARVEIFFNPHIRPGSPVPREAGSPWEQVDELVDKPPRWLQELYPVDELIAPVLGLSPNDISFEAYAGPDDITYEARAYDAGGRCLLRDTLRVVVSEQPYLPPYPDQGVCAPATGWLRVESDRERLLDRPVATDSERLWDFYRREILSALSDFIARKAEGDEPPALPFFARLELDISISEPERPLPTRSDLLSMGEVLSEDFFDAARAYLAAFCTEKWGARFDAAGHILPRIHIRPGAPRMTATLYDHLKPAPCVLTNGHAIECAPEPVTARVTRVTGGTRGLRPHFSIDCPERLAQRLRPLAELAQKGVAELSRMLAPYGGLALLCGGQRLELPLPHTPVPVRDLCIDAIDLPVDRVIGYEDWSRLARQLMRVPGLDVYAAGSSFYGRTVYAVELSCPLPGYVSTVKRLLRGPSILVGGRHHANEVSSSNALCQLMRALVTEPQYQNLSQRLCLTLLPMENVDGAALLDELRAEHPGWAHHSCYTPPLGRDLYGMYFQDGAVNADGRAFSGLYRRTLPDAFIDVHGVPGHDWQHQFASLRGYKGLWAPRALICAFSWYCRDERYRDNLRFNRAWADAVGQAYFSHPDLQCRNAEWRERFDKYSYNGINLDFPCAFENRMLNYWVPNAYHPRHPYLSVRFPWVTSVSFTAEAADEGATGRALRECAEAQLVHLRAGIGVCLSAQKAYRCGISPDAGGLYARLLRLRPLIPQ